MSSRTSAAFPQGRYSRPSPSTIPLRIVTFTDEEGGSWSFDFTELAGPARVDRRFGRGGRCGFVSRWAVAYPDDGRGRGEYGPPARSVLDRRVSRGGFWSLTSPQRSGGRGGNLGRRRRGGLGRSIRPPPSCRVAEASGTTRRAYARRHPNPESACRRTMRTAGREFTVFKPRRKRRFGRLRRGSPTICRLWTGSMRFRRTRRLRRLRSTRGALDIGVSAGVPIAPRSDARNACRSESGE